MIRLNSIFLLTLISTQAILLLPFAVYGATLTADISAIPSSGKAPLNDVDLTATVSGTSIGDITYRFDCKNDGSWERIETTNSTNYTAFDLCDYDSAGNYTAKVSVEREGLTFQSIIGITVTEADEEDEDIALKVEKKVRNVSKGQSDFKNSITADPSDSIEFRIKITSVGTNIAEDIIIKDTLPDLLIYKGNLKIDGVSASGNILSGFETEIGDLSSGQTKIITFEAEVASKESFVPGTTKLINTALAYNDKIAVTETATVNVYKEGTLGAVTSVSTGFFNLATVTFVITCLIGFLLTYFLLLRFYVVKHVLPKSFQTKAERALLRNITKIKDEENIL